MMRQFLPHFRPEKHDAIADDETMASSSRKDGKDGFILENKIWILKNMQAKVKITKNVSTKQLIGKIKEEIAKIESTNREIYLKYKREINQINNEVEAV